MSIATGSGLERFMSCRASSLLPRVFDADGSVFATRGKVVHTFLERVAGGMTADEALGLIEGDDLQHREACAALDLGSVSDLLALAPEVTLAINMVTGTARIVGQALDRAYDAAGVTADEVPLTMDTIGVDIARRRGFVADYKTGWARLPRAGSNWQMRGGAIALALAFDLDEVEVQVVYLREGQVVRRDRHLFTAADLAEIRGQLEATWANVLEDRARFDATGALADATMGGWCKYCPSRPYCPGYTGIIRAVVAPEDVRDNPLRIGRLTDDQLGEAYRKVKAAKAALEAVTGAIHAAAAERAFIVETRDDGAEIWLGQTEVEGNDKLDAAIVIRELQEMLAPDDDHDAGAIREEVAVASVTKARIEAAIKLRVPKGQGAPTMRKLLAYVDQAGGITRTRTTKVAPYIVLPDRAARRLP